MLADKLRDFDAVIDSFSGRNGEPANNTEVYILKAMWVMLLSEFESMLRDHTEEYIDFLKTKPITDISICVLVNNFYGEAEEALNLNKVVGLYKRKTKDISYSNFTRNKKARYKSFSVENLFNSLGVFLSESEIDKIKFLDGIASTRDAIAHGDKDISITRSELKANAKTLIEISDFLYSKFTFLRVK